MFNGMEIKYNSQIFYLVIVLILILVIILLSNDKTMAALVFTFITQFVLLSINLRRLKEELDKDKNTNKIIDDDINKLVDMELNYPKNSEISPLVETDLKPEDKPPVIEKSELDSIPGAIGDMLLMRKLEEDKPLSTHDASIQMMQLNENHAIKQRPFNGYDSMKKLYEGTIEENTPWWDIESKKIDHKDDLVKKIRERSRIAKNTYAS